MKKIKKMINIISTLLIISLITFIMCMNFFPKETSRVVGFQMYTVLTDSMEPTIPTNSVVFTKVVDPSDKLTLKKGDIITFHADRFGEDILITHRFNKMQKNNEGVWCYRTNAEGKDNLDMYETKRSDIVGTYVFHIPYVGKFILFLQSKFGLLLYAELLIIFLVNQFFKAKWKEEEDNDASDKKPIKITIDSIQITQQESSFSIQACATNLYKHSIAKMQIEVCLYNKEKEELLCFKKRVAFTKRLPHKGKETFTIKNEFPQEIEDISIKVLGYKIY